MDQDTLDQGPLRRCFATDEVRAKADLIRFVVGPDGRIVPDLAERLPGRGLWLTARRDIVATAIKKRLFQRAARAAVKVEDGLPQRIEELLASYAQRFAVDFLARQPVPDKPSS